MRSTYCGTLCIAVALLTLVADSANAQHTWQKPSTPLKRPEVDKLIGPVSNDPLSKPRHIVWVWGYDGGHQPGNHDYTRVRDLMVGLLQQVSKVTIETAYLFPTKTQFERADLVVMYLHLPGLDAEHYALLDPYLSRGGGLVAIHETMIQRPRARGQQWARRIGLAWSEGESQWGALFTDVRVNNEHQIFANLPEHVEIVDEFYWHLHQANDKQQQTLATVPVGPPRQSRGPVASEKLSGERYPVFWTMRFGEGRVFCSLPGHNTFLFYGPRFRIILFRGLAWAMNEQPDPLMPLVTAGIEQNGLVGTTDTMRDWRQKPRNLKGEGFAPDASVEMINATTNQRYQVDAKQ